jgi:ligand-binding sensor domain-containing protein/two-component sensor histidine kinase
MKSWLFCSITLPCIIATVFTSSVRAQRLPVRDYNVADGLAHNIVGPAYQDSRGYIWFGSDGGLSRFDGYRFINYGVEDGLAHPVVNCITEDKQGRLWVGTNRGICRLIDDPAERQRLTETGQLVGLRKFITYRIGESFDSNAVDSLLFDNDGTLWCTSDEIYRAMPHSNDQLKFEIAITHKGEWTEFKSFIDSRGRLWFGTLRELIEFVDGQVIRYGSADGLPMELTRSVIEPRLFNEGVTSITEDQKGRVIVSNRREVFEFLEPRQQKELRGRWRKLPFSIASDLEIASIRFNSRGAFIGATGGLLSFESGEQSGSSPVRYLSGERVSNLFEDRDGNLWVSTTGAGIHRFGTDFILHYTTADGLPPERLMAVFQDRAGTIYAMTRGGIATIAGSKVELIPGSQSAQFKALTEALLFDSHGNCWLRTSQVLYQLPAEPVDFSRAHKVTAADVAPGSTEQNREQPRIFGLGIFEDPSGRMWCGGLGDPALYTCDPSGAGNRVPCFKRIALDESLGVPPAKKLDSLHCAVADKSGALWFGWQGDLGRYKDGKLTLFEPTQGLPRVTVRALFVDSRGWLWIGLEGIVSGGLSVTRDPSAEQPIFANYSTSTGLGTNTVYSIVEDKFGRVYVPSDRGIDRLDPLTGTIRHFTASDGITAPAAAGAFVADREGNIWIPTANGLFRLNPQHEPPEGSPHPPFFTDIYSGGEKIPVPERGSVHISGLELTPSHSELRIEFASISSGTGQIRYQYRLEGSDRDWSQPSEDRTLNYAGFSSGKHRLLVRALDAGGVATSEPSVLEFRVLPPIWQRWWFVAGVALVLVASGFSLHRIRLRQIIAMEKIRNQVATDLHDEVGSGLAQIAILSEVAKRDSSPEAKGLLNEVAELARSMRDSMSDIVWAVDPRKDSLSDLVQRMRQVSFNLLESHGIRVSFQAPDDRELERTSLAPDRKRHLLLIFKEAITNVARHADASTVHIEVSAATNELCLAVSDDGRGFDEEARHNGHGLSSMRQRARELGGQLEIRSTAETGTSTELRIPV